MPLRLPSFRSPPVVETALSVQFKPLSKFTNAYLGLFWATLRAEFPEKTDADPIEPQTERFGAEAARQPRLPSFRFVTSQAAVRLQMASIKGDTMIQVQNGRLVFNWRRLHDDTYPRWQEVRPAFDVALTRLGKFLEGEGLGEIQPNQWEVTYVNHLRHGREWTSQGELDQVVPGLIGTGVRPLIGIVESLGCNWRLSLPEERGRLHIDLNHGYLGTEESAQEVIVLQLTARGGVEPDKGWDLSEGLQLGRNAIVRTFDAITGPGMHILWGKET